MRNTKKSLLAAVLLVAVTTGVQAAKPDQDDDQHGKGHSKGQSQQQSQKPSQQPSQKREAVATTTRQTSYRSPVQDSSRVRRLVVEHRSYYQQAAALPPGIARNVGRGKPLPPGIARKLDPRMVRELPRYEGYEWKQVGSDIVLVAITTGIVVEILDHLFD